MVDELIMQLVGLRYTEPDMTVSYPGFLFLLMKLESMIRKLPVRLPRPPGGSSTQRLTG